MFIAMGITSVLCIVIGTFPNQTLYQFLPNKAAEYVPYTTAHVVTQLQLLFFSALAFAMLMLAGIYPAEIRSVNLDSDWFYRIYGKYIYIAFDKSLNGINKLSHKFFIDELLGSISHFCSHGPAHLILFIFTPLWTLQGMPENEINERRKKIYTKVEAGAFPIGITAVLAIIFIALFLY